MADRTYELRLFDRPLMSFRFEPFGNVEVVDHDEGARDLLPFGIGLAGDEVARWLTTRALPQNRLFADRLCMAMGIPAGDTEAIYRAGLGLSLNDSYWLAPEGFDGTFSEVNLYENDFSEALAAVAYTGRVGSPGSLRGLTPELTTDGGLPKAWRIEDDGTRVLYKGSTPGFEPGEVASEVLVSAVCQALGVNAVPYAPSVWEDVPCSKCTCFCTPELSYAPFAVATGITGLASALWFHARRGWLEGICDMLAVDDLLCNTDRHLANFGILYDARTREPVSPAPMFDNGRALFPNVAEGDPGAFRTAALYARPAFSGPSFEESAARCAGERQHELFRLAADGACDEALAALGPRGEAVASFVRERGRALDEIPVVDHDRLVVDLERTAARRAAATADHGGVVRVGPEYGGLA